MTGTLLNNRYRRASTCCATSQKHATAADGMKQQLLAAS